MFPLKKQNFVTPLTTGHTKGGMKKNTVERNINSIFTAKKGDEQRVHLENHPVYILNTK